GLVQEVRATGPLAGGALGRDLALDDLVDRHLLAVEGRVGVLALGDDGAVDLDAGVEAARLDVREVGLQRRAAAPALRLLVILGLQLAVVRRLGRSSSGSSSLVRGLLLALLLRLAAEAGADVHDAAGAVGARDDGDVGAQADAVAEEGVEGLAGVDDEHGVVDVGADHEAGADGVDLDAGGRAPGAVGQAGDEDAGAGGAGELEAGAEGGEDGEADGLVDHLARDLDDGLLLLLGLVRGDGARGAAAAGVGLAGLKLLGGRLLLLGRDVGCDALLCGADVSHALWSDGV
ncbi:hypothetical protein N0V92_013979, partial [Colletotrichum tropicale]